MALIASGKRIANPFTRTDVFTIAAVMLSFGCTGRLSIGLRPSGHEEKDTANIAMRLRKVLCCGLR
jgi:hypothetical protein